jgi:hypothetical protein
MAVDLAFARTCRGNNVDERLGGDRREDVTVVRSGELLRTS